MENSLATLYHQVWINAAPTRVYEAIATAAGVGSWWGKQTERRSGEGVFLEHDPGPAHGVVSLEVLRSIKDRRVEWECVSQHPSTSPASAWTGTHLTFDISERANLAAMSGFGADGDRIVVLDFRHSGWNESSPYLGFCNFAWGQALAGLKKVCEAR
jgi:hypothetical protein